MKFLKGMGAGLLMGACMGMVMAPDPKKSKRQLSGAVKAVGQAIEDFGTSLKF